MSDQNTLSRRRALSLLGATALTAQTAAARSQDVIAAATPTRPRYIFGYGSLIERESRMATWPSAQFASPVIVKGVARGWFDQTDVPSWSPTYLGGIAEANAETNGVIFRVTVSGVRQLHPARDRLQADADRPLADHHARRQLSRARRRHLVLCQRAEGFPLRRCIRSCSRTWTYASTVAWKSRQRIHGQSRPTSPSVSSGRRATGDRHGSTTASILGGHSSTCRARGKSTR